MRRDHHVVEDVVAPLEALQSVAPAVDRVGLRERGVILERDPDVVEQVEPLAGLRGMWAHHYHHCLLTGLSRSSLDHGCFGRHAVWHDFGGGLWRYH